MLRIFPKNPQIPQNALICQSSISSLGGKSFLGENHVFKHFSANSGEDLLGWVTLIIDVHLERALPGNTLTGPRGSWGSQGGASWAESQGRYGILKRTQKSLWKCHIGRNPWELPAPKCTVGCGGVMDRSLGGHIDYSCLWIKNLFREKKVVCYFRKKKRILGVLPFWWFLIEKIDFDQKSQKT